MARRTAPLRRDVPFLTERQIEDEATVLLAEYGRDHGDVTAPPIPIDEIIEIHLQLTFELKDLAKLFGHGDVHGALWVNKKLVGVDQSLDPTVRPSMLGPFSFHAGARDRALALAPAILPAEPEPEDSLIGGRFNARVHLAIFGRREAGRMAGKLLRGMSIDAAEDGQRGLGGNAWELEADRIE